MIHALNCYRIFYEKLLMAQIMSLPDKEHGRKDLCCGQKSFGLLVHCDGRVGNKRKPTTTNKDTQLTTRGKCC